MRGITITLIEKTQTGIDSLNHPRFKEVQTTIDNVLVGEPTSDEIATTMSLYGKRAKYTLAIPKGDAHDWTDTKVILPEPFAGTYKTIGYPTAGIETLIPLAWNKKVIIETYG